MAILFVCLWSLVMPCVCCSHVGECCAGHVPYSSPNLHATNIYFSVFFSFLPCTFAKRPKYANLFPLFKTHYTNHAVPLGVFATKLYFYIFFVFLPFS